MKEQWAIMLCAVLFITTLAGCGSTKEKDFENMEKFIKDTNMQPDVVEFDDDPVINMFANNEVAIVTGTSRWANDFRNQGVNVMFLPYF